MIATKPLLYAVGALLLALVVLGSAYYKRGMQLDVAKASSSSAMALARSYDTERKAWKLRAEELQTSVEAHQHALSKLGLELQIAQDQATIIRERNDQALAAARAELDEANATLTGFIDRYREQMRTPECPAALEQLEAACPALSPY